MDLIRWALEGTFGAIEEIGANIKTETKEEVDGEDDSQMKDAVDDEIPMEQTQSFLVMGCVILRYHSRTREIELEWEGNMMNDGVADAVMAVLLTVESSPASVKQSAKDKHHHHHHHDDDTLPHPHAHLGTDDRLTRLLMMLEAQFGSEIAPIERPRVPSELANGSAEEEHADAVKEERTADIESAELDRLHALGIPVPGLEIKVDKHVARVWLENLEVECSNAVLRDRVRIVVERAIETVAGLWAPSSMPKEAGVPAQSQIDIEASAAKDAAAIEASG